MIDFLLLFNKWSTLREYETNEDESREIAMNFKIFNRLQSINVMILQTWYRVCVWFSQYTACVYHRNSFFFCEKENLFQPKKIQMGSDSYILGKGIVEHLSSDRSSSVAANSKLLYFDCVTLAQCFCRLRVIANVHTLTQNIYIHTYVLYIYSALLCCSCYTNSLIYLITYNMTDNLYRSIIHVNTLAIAFYAGGKKVAIQILGSLVYGYNLHKHM